MYSSSPSSGGSVTTSAKTPLWKRLVIILSAVVAGIVAAFVIGQAEVSWALTIVAGAAVTLLALWVVARLLHVRLKRGWE
jgi:membrane protein implicated in regulation of membrane protease activity